MECVLNGDAPKAGMVILCEAPTDVRRFRRALRFPGSRFRAFPVATMRVAALSTVEIRPRRRRHGAKITTLRDPPRSTTSTMSNRRLEKRPDFRHPSSPLTLQ